MRFLGQISELIFGELFDGAFAAQVAEAFTGDEYEVTLLVA